VQDLAVLAGEDQAGIDPGSSPGEALLELPDPVGLEGGHGERVEGELPEAAGRLGLGDDHGLPIHNNDGLDDGEPARRGLQVDRPPGQAEQFASAHPGGGEQQPHRAQAVLARRLEERPELLGRPHTALPAGDTWRVGSVGDVAGDQAPTHRITKRLVQQHVDVADALRLEPAAAVPPPMFSEIRVEAVQMSGGQRLERNVAERWEDLSFGVDAVGRPGGRPHSGPHGR
jgi:hypothetical protein